MSEIDKNMPLVERLLQSMTEWSLVAALPLGLELRDGKSVARSQAGSFTTYGKQYERLETPGEGFARQDLQKLHPHANTVMTFTRPDGTIFRYGFKNRIIDNFKRNEVVPGLLMARFPNALAQQLMTEIRRHPVTCDRLLLAAFPSFRTQLELIECRELLIIPTGLPLADLKAGAQILPFTS